MIHNIQNPDCELGGFESGNGLLFGDAYSAVANNGVYVSYNSFAHNENFQAKNNPLQNMITLGPNFLILMTLKTHLSARCCLPKS